MTTQNTLIYQIYEALQISSDDTTLDDRLIADLIAEERALWIRNEQNKNRSIDDNIIQDLGCVPMEPVVPNSPECCCTDLPDDCMILRSTVQIPNAVELYQEKLVTRIGPTLLNKKPFALITFEAAPYFGNGRFNKNQIAAFVRNNYVYLIGYNQDIINLIEDINVQGVFEDPRAAGRFKTCSGQPCWTPDSKYPVNQWMWAQWIKPRVLEKLRTKLELPIDESNNGQDNNPPQAQGLNQ